MTGHQALKPCPFCGSEIKHVESWARSFDPPRLYHEWHHVADNEDSCPIRAHIGKIVTSATDDVEMQETRISRWNTRIQAPAAPPVSEGVREAIKNAVAWFDHGELFPKRGGERVDKNHRVNIGPVTRKVFDDLRTALCNAPPASEGVARVRAQCAPWQSIETAPKDGAHIIVANRFNPNIPAATVHWFDGGWHLSVNQMGEYSEYVWGPPTDWMPVPAVSSTDGGTQRNLGVASDSDRATTVPDRTTDATPRNDPQEPTSRDSRERPATTLTPTDGGGAKRSGSA